MTDAELIDKALSLSPTDRATLIDQLYESFSTSPSVDVDQKWIAECDSRMAAVNEGRMGTTDAAKVFSKINES